MIGWRDARGLVRSVADRDIVMAVDGDGVVTPVSEAALAAGTFAPVSEAVRVAGNLAAIKAVSAPPWQCGDAIPLSVARGRVLRFVPSELAPDGKGGMKPQPTGYRCRDGARCADVFDVMILQAERAHARLGRKAGTFVPPFSHGQVVMGREYAALVERCNASGVKCSSLEALRQAGRGGDREAAIFRDFARLRALQRRIGDGLAKTVRRHRPSTSSAGGDSRRSITVRHLVDQVCLADRTLSEVLTVNGWARNAQIIKGLRDDLCMALDRMQGYRDHGPQNIA